MRKLAVLLVLLASGCHNACQDVCHTMANYAENECGYTISDGDLDACFDRMAGKNLEDGARKACRQFGSKSDIDENFGCDELADYFDAPGDATTDSP
jgi:hypothetical protein